MSSSDASGFPVDQIYHGDSRNMKEVPDGIVSLIVCSPPYNVRKPYSNHNDDMPLAQYRKMLLDVWRECRRVLRPGGRLCVNVAGVWRQPYLPLHSIIWQQLVGRLRFRMRGEIIWDKGASVGVSTAWGSFASPSNPTLRDGHEYVLVAAKDADGRAIAHEAVSVFCKGGFGLPNSSGSRPDIDKEDFVEWTRSVWHLPTESASRVGHPAPFPVELPRRLILLYTYPGDIVLDPFAGSGSTCVAARLTDRHYIGYDIDGDYVRVARERVSQVSKQLAMPIPGLPEASPRRPGRTRKGKELLRMGATALLGPSEVRNREIRLSIAGGQIVLGIKTADRPDVQKQNVIAALPPSDATALAESLLRAAKDLERKADGDAA